MLTINDDFTTASNLKYRIEQFYKHATYETAKAELSKLMIELRDSGLEEMSTFANTLARWQNEIVNSFIIVDREKGKKMNNRSIENRNRGIKQLKHNSNGYKNWERFRTRWLYVLNEDATFHLHPMM